MKGQLSREKLLLLVFSFSVALVIISWPINTFLLHSPLLAMFKGNEPVLWQIAGGVLYGTAAGAAGLFFLIKIPALQELRNLFTYIVREFQLTVPVIVFISACAGVSEEILFRGSIQELIGVFWASFLFIALHGYLNPLNWRISIYGLLMFVVSLGLGLLYEWMGLIAAIFAHTIVDVVILWGLRVRLR